jgi:hypothetical protein
VARFNEIQRGGLNAILHKTLAMEEGAPAPQLSGDIVPVINLENDRPEYRYLAGERLCQGGIYVSGVAAATSKVGLFNPKGSGVLGVVHHMHFQAESAGEVRLYGTNRGNSLTNKASATLMDGRANDGFDVGGPFPSIQIDWENVAGFVGRAIDYYRHAANTFWNMPIDLVLPPDCGVHLVGITVDKWLSGGFQWTERALESSER